MKKISVIIPVYKVPSYLDQCIKSVINQTYTNLEIILVDDGSPDSCPSKCDYWASIDNRIQVIHKTNGGLSSARNAGLEISTGDYISFIDSDDWIEHNMFYEMIQIFQKHDVDFVACKVACFFQDIGSYGPFMEGKDRYRIKNDQIIDKCKYRQLLIGNHIEAAAWNKLYKREYIGDNRFCEGRLFEDYLFAYYATRSMSSMFYMAKSFYNYRIRNNSITTSGDYADNWEKNFAEIKQGLIKEGDRILLDELYNFQFRYYLNTYTKLNEKSKRNTIRNTINKINVKFRKLPNRMKIKYILFKLRLL